MFSNFKFHVQKFKLHESKYFLIEVNSITRLKWHLVTFITPFGRDQTSWCWLLEIGLSETIVLDQEMGFVGNFRLSFRRLQIDLSFMDIKSCFTNLESHL